MSHALTRWYKEQVYIFKFENVCIEGQENLGNLEIYYLELRPNF